MMSYRGVFLLVGVIGAVSLLISYSSFSTESGARTAVPLRGQQSPVDISEVVSLRKTTDELNRSLSEEKATSSKLQAQVTELVEKNKVLMKSIPKKTNCQYGHWEDRRAPRSPVRPHLPSNIFHVGNKSQRAAVRDDDDDVGDTAGSARDDSVPRQVTRGTEGPRAGRKGAHEQKKSSASQGKRRGGTRSLFSVGGDEDDWLQQVHTSAQDTHPLEPGSDDGYLTGAGVWEPDPRCHYYEYDAYDAAMCLARQGRTVILGDSVQRGVFYDLVGLLVYGGNAGKLRIKTTPERKSSSFMTNFEDRQIFVYEEATGELLASVRFTFGSHITEFKERCNLMRDWGFSDCPTPADGIVKILYEQEVKGDKRRSFAGAPASKELEEFEEDPDAFPEVMAVEVDNTIVYPRATHGNKVGLFYWSLGTWDWRTGRSVRKFEEAMGSFMTAAAPLVSSSQTMVYRLGTPAYPDKFAGPSECRAKPRRDDRPCGIHTDGLLHYNDALDRVVQSWRDDEMDLTSNIARLDAWEVTATRPDMTVDGIHYREGSMKGDVDFHPKDVAISPTYRVINNQFFTLLCGDPHKL